MPNVWFRGRDKAKILDSKLNETENHVMLNVSHFTRSYRLLPSKVVDLG